MKSTDELGNFVDVRLSQFSPLETAIELLILREAPHPDSVFHYPALAVEPELLSVPSKGDHVKVQVRGQPAIDTEFLGAEVRSPLEGAEVQKPQVHRFLDLVGVVTCENDPGNMGLDQLHAAHGMREAAGIQQHPDIGKFALVFTGGQRPGLPICRRESDGAGDRP